MKETQSPLFLFLKPKYQKKKAHQTEAELLLLSACFLLCVLSNVCMYKRKRALATCCCLSLHDVSL